MSDCPNCRDVGSRDVVSRVALGQYCTEDGLQCQNCGAVAWKNGELFVPRRSQPADELPLPDADDWWWWRNNLACGAWETVRVVMAPGPRMSRVGLPYHQSCLSGRYVRLSMPVQPEPVDEDAEWLRELAKLCRYDDDQVRAPMLRRIASRLESQGKEPQ